MSDRATEHGAIGQRAMSDTKNSQRDIFHHCNQPYYLRNRRCFAPISLPAPLDALLVASNGVIYAPLGQEVENKIENQKSKSKDVTGGSFSNRSFNRCNCD